MIKQYFKELAAQEQGKFYYYDEDVDIGGGSRNPYVIFLIKFYYRDHEIIVDNRTGTSFEGCITCNLASYAQPIDFEITSISHIANLFLRKKSRFKINCSNKNLGHFLKTNDSLKELSIIAQKEDFSPYIRCEERDGKYSIITNYHLEFGNWTQVLEPLIAFYKDIVDLLEKHIAHLSYDSYLAIRSGLNY